MAFRKPGTKRVGLKVLLKGEQGSGKTLTALTFPKVAALDGENGMSLYEGEPEGKNIVMIDNTQSYLDLEDSIDYINDVYEDEGIESLIIDSETKFYENIKEIIMDVEEKRAKRKGRDVLDTNLSVRSWGKIGGIADKLQNMKIDLTSKGVNVISIVQVSDVKEKQGDSFVVVGKKSEMRKGAEYDYDIVLFQYTEEAADGKTKYFGRVEKDRSKVFKKGDIIENPSYKHWAKRLNKMGDKEALNTSYTTNSDEGKKVYEEELIKEEMSLKDRMVELSKNADEETRKEIAEALKNAKISSFEGLTAKQQEKLEAIYQQFK